MDLITHIHEDPLKLAIVAAGGASEVISQLLTIPGASSTVLDAAVPYSTAALDEYLAQEALPAQVVSQEGAQKLGMAAYRRAVQYGRASGCVAGFAVTCALATTKPKQGAHRLHGALLSPPHNTYFAASFTKGARTRAQEERLATTLCLHVIAACLQNPPAPALLPPLPFPLQAARPPPGAIDASADVAYMWREEEGEPLARLRAGEVRSVEYQGGGVYVDAPRPGLVVLPGSFNPLHEGHVGMLTAAAERWGEGRQAVYELSIGNADKGMLEDEETQRRVSQFDAHPFPVVCTQAPLFTHKATLFPRSLFVVGYDTAIRLVMKKYYSNSHARMLAAFEQMRVLGCRFVVAGRSTDGGNFLQLSDIELPEDVVDMFVALEEEQFRVDISSTELRQKQAASS